MDSINESIKHLKIISEMSYDDYFEHAWVYRELMNKCDKIVDIIKNNLK